MIIQYLSLMFFVSGALPLASVTHNNSATLSSKVLGDGFVSAISQNSLVSKILGNSSSFLSAMAQVDPIALKNIIITLKELKATSESQEKSLLDALNTKIAELGTASNNVVLAEEDVNLAKQNLAEKEQSKIEKERIVVGKAVEKSDANKAYEDGKKNLDSEQQVLDSVITQLENLLGEQASREEIVSGKGVLITEKFIDPASPNWKITWDMKITLNLDDIGIYGKKYYRGSYLLWFSNPCRPSNRWGAAGDPELRMGNSRSYGMYSFDRGSDHCSDYAVNSNPGKKLEDWNHYGITVQTNEVELTMNGKKICGYRATLRGCKDKVQLWAGQPENQFIGDNIESGGALLKNVNWVPNP